MFDAKAFVAGLPGLPGVYRMLGPAGEALYVGKAKNLKRRVGSYFGKASPSPRIGMMLAQVGAIEVTATRSEAEALLSLAPRYNILFRDDKSYPYLMMTGHAFPRIGFHRGARERGNRYFGPFPHAHAVRERIQLLQRVFRLRTCEDTVFENRSRPCLLHQIRRCTAPCTGEISAEQYAQDVRSAQFFLEGREDDVIRLLSRKMEDASAGQRYEEAALYRDQARALSRVQARQYVESERGVDADVVACSPASVYRVLKKAGLLAGQTPNVTKKGTGYVQPLQAHQEWHIDVSYLNIAGTFYFLCSILDGYSRSITHWEIREKMEESDVQTILQRAREKFPGATPRLISDNGPQFIAKDFKEFVRRAGMTHVRTSPYYPQSNGKIERWHKTLKGDCIRVQVPLAPDEARRIVADYVQHYNHVRLHSAIGYVTPHDRLLGHDDAIHAARDRKLAEARERRQQLRQTRHEHRAAPAADARPAIDFAAVRAAISIAQVLALLGFAPRSDRAGQQRGACPVHGSTNGTACCFSVNTHAHTFQCFKCGGSDKTSWRV